MSGNGANLREIKSDFRLNLGYARMYLGFVLNDTPPDGKIDYLNALDQSINNLQTLKKNTLELAPHEIDKFKPEMHFMKGVLGLDERVRGLKLEQHTYRISSPSTFWTEAHDTNSPMPLKEKFILLNDDLNALKVKMDTHYLNIDKKRASASSKLNKSG